MLAGPPAGVEEWEGLAAHHWVHPGVLSPTQWLFLTGLHWQETQVRTSLVVQRLRLCTLSAGLGLGSIPGQEARSHTPQLGSPPTTEDPAGPNK